MLTFIAEMSLIFTMIIANIADSFPIIFVMYLHCFDQDGVTTDDMSERKCDDDEEISSDEELFIRGVIVW